MRALEILNLREGEPFRMGSGVNWRIIHPDMGAEQLTLNHAIHGPGHEFTQHVHDRSEDIFIVLEGGVSVRQGDVYTPIWAGEAAFIPVGEVHGTVNTTDADARLISFQCPPDMALYNGTRDKGDIPRPRAGHTSGVQIITLAKGSPVFGKPCEWRNVICAEKGARHMAVDYIRLSPGEGFEHEPEETEVAYVLLAGGVEVGWRAKEQRLAKDDVIFAGPGDGFAASQVGAEALVLVRTQARVGQW